MMGWLADLPLTLPGAFLKALGKNRREWAEWADKEPGAAAEELTRQAGDLEARAVARRKQNGWLARKLRAKARGMREHAADLRARARGEECERDHKREPGS